MTVMVIMFILMGMSTMALRGVMRGTGISGAVATARGALTLARQHAILNQRQTAVIFRATAATNSMHVLARYGGVAFGDGNGFTASGALPWTPAELKGRYNQNENRWEGGVVFNFKGQEDVITGGNGLQYLTLGQITWTSGDVVAFPVGQVRHLHESMRFVLPANPTTVVVFNSDGSLDAAEDITIGVRERNVASAETIDLVVDHLTGRVNGDVEP